MHLLLKEGKEPLSTIFRRFGASFVYRYNIKYERVGHLFRDRYRSEPIEDDDYFLTCLRYILRNPVKGGICEQIGDYRYSSAVTYLKGGQGITDTTFALQLMPAQQLTEFLNTENDDQCLDMQEEKAGRQTDESGIRMIRESFGTPTPVVPENGDFTELAKKITELNRKGISIRQLCRLSGLRKPLVEKCLAMK